MLLSLVKIIDRPGKSIPFDVTLDLHELVFGGCYPITEPVKAVGEIRNEAGVLLLGGTVTTTLHGVCDRCATEYERAFCVLMHAVLVQEFTSEEGEEDPWSFLLDNNCIDLDDVIHTTVVLNMDSKFLCKEDCKGLCCRCGKNLNEGPCGCKKELDPRFAVLKQLLESKE